MIRKQKLENNVLIYLMLFFATLNIFEFGATIWLLATIVIMIIHLLKYQRIILANTIQDLVFYSIFTIGASLASILFLGLNDLIKSVIPLFSLVSSALLVRMVDNRRVFLRRLLFVIFLAYLTQVILLYFHNINISRESQRVLYSLWGNKRISVTLVAVLCSYIIGYSISMVFYCKKLLFKFMFLIPLVFVVLINLMTATRTPFLIMIIVLLGTTLLYMKKAATIIKIRVIAGGLFFAFLGLLCYFSNAFGIKTLIMNSPLFSRALESGLETSRGTIFLNHLNGMSISIFGGGQIQKVYGYAHNIVQESYDLYGILALISILYCLVDFIRTLRVLSKTNNYYLFIVLPIYLAVVLQFLSEPIFEGYPLIFWNLIFINTALKTKTNELFYSSERYTNFEDKLLRKHYSYLR